MALSLFCHTRRLKNMHNLIIIECGYVNENVNAIVNLAQIPENVVQMFKNMNLYPRYGMAITPTTYYPSICNAISYLFLYSSSGAKKLRRGVGLKTEVCWNTKIQWGCEGWALHPNDNVETWPYDFVGPKPTSSNAITSSSHVRLIPTFIGHTLERFGHLTIHFFLLPFMQWLMSYVQNQSFFCIYVIVWRKHLLRISLPCVPCLLLLTLALHAWSIFAYNA